VSRNKLERFQDNKESENVLEPGKEIFGQIKGNWKRVQFKNDHPITIELGCGRGEYTIGLGKRFPETNFIGIDIKGDRIWVGSQHAKKENLHNVAFLRTQLQFLDRFFEKNEVDTIWLTFPDPRPKERDEKRRLTFPGYMELYRSILKPEGWFHFKTDNTGLFEYTLGLFDDKRVQVKNLHYTFDLYNSEMREDHFGIVTKYEKIWTDKGSKIKYVKFQFE
jgi:tRNA (guanine-N7-)-methyltransferase